MHNPTKEHTLMLRTLIQYLNGARNYKLVFSRYEPPIIKHLELYAEKDKTILSLFKIAKSKWLTNKEDVPFDPVFGNTDADYAHKFEDSRKSTSGYCFFAWHNICCWKSKLQPILATSTHEAELIALNSAAQEAIWLRNLISEINYAITGKLTDLPPTHIFCDNLGACHTANNPKSSGSSKHIEIRYLKIREYQQDSKLVVKHVDGTKNTADMFTKPLANPQHQAYCKAIGMQLT